jgi:hypothetical protein
MKLLAIVMTFTAVSFAQTRNMENTSVDMPDQAQYRCCVKKSEKQCLLHAVQPQGGCPGGFESIRVSAGVCPSKGTKTCN